MILMMKKTAKEEKSTCFRGGDLNQRWFEESNRIRGTGDHRNDDACFWRFL